MTDSVTTSHARVDDSILLIRGRRVMLDVDLGRLYGVTTKRLNEQVKRNERRFPPDFMFRLDANEVEELVANCDRFINMKHSSVLPRAFTEHGAIMLASVLNTSCAIEASLLVVRVKKGDVSPGTLILEKRPPSRRNVPVATSGHCPTSTVPACAGGIHG